MIKKRKTKIDVAKGWLNDSANMKWLLDETHLYLENNHGPEIANLYFILKGEIPGILTKADVKRLKWVIISDVLCIVQRAIEWDCDVIISESTIKKAMNETDSCLLFNAIFRNSIEESDNLKIFKKYF